MSNRVPDVKNQRSRILRLLVLARGEWVPLPKILELRISQYGARIYELRRLGFRISNRTENRDGKRLSYFRLEASPVTTLKKANKPLQPTLFDLGELHKDLG